MVGGGDGCEVWESFISIWVSPFSLYISFRRSKIFLSVSLRTRIIHPTFVDFLLKLRWLGSLWKVRQLIHLCPPIHHTFLDNFVTLELHHLHYSCHPCHLSPWINASIPFVSLDHRLCMHVFIWCQFVSSLWDQCKFFFYVCLRLSMRCNKADVR